MFVKLARDWFFNGELYKAGVREIPGLEGYAKGLEKKVKDVLPKGAEIVDGGVTDLPAVHPTVTTLSELAKVRPQDAVTASKGPSVTVSEAAMKGEAEKPAEPVKVDGKK